MSIHQAGLRDTARDIIGIPRLRYIQSIVTIGIVAGAIGLIPQIMVGMQKGTLNTLAIGSTLLFIIINLLVLMVSRRGQLELATSILVLIYTVGVLIAPTGYILLGALTLIMGATLGSRNIHYFTLLLVLSIGGYNILRLAGELGVAASQVIHQVIMVGTLAMVGFTVRHLINTSEQSGLAFQRSAHLLQASAEVGQVMSKMLELDELLPRAVELIRDRFAFYHVQVFMVDEARDYARLVASTGEVGQQLLEREHKLMVGSRSVIGSVTQHAEPVIVTIASADVVHYRNELLPNTRSELALPIMDGEEIIGALDVQSTREDAFTQTDIQALQVMANQLATAIRNARLFTAQAENVRDNKRLFLESETNLREIQRLNRQLTKAAWSDYLSSNSFINGVTLSESGLVNSAKWTESMHTVSQKRRSVVQEQDDTQIITVPIVLRNEVLGAVEVEVSGDARKGNTAEMVQAVAQRLAVSLDNARLFEEAQEATAQEQHINEIVARYQAANSVDDLLHITLAELSETFGAERSVIRLGRLQEGSDTQNGGSEP